MKGVPEIVSISSDDWGVCASRVGICKNPEANKENNTTPSHHTQEKSVCRYQSMYITLSNIDIFVSRNIDKFLGVNSFV